MSEGDELRWRMWPLLLFVIAGSQISLFQLALPALEPVSRPAIGLDFPIWYRGLSTLGLYVFYLVSIGSSLVGLGLVIDFVRRRAIAAASLSGLLLLAGIAASVLSLVSTAVPLSMALTLALECAISLAMVILCGSFLGGPRSLSRVQVGALLWSLPFFIHVSGDLALATWVGQRGLWSGFFDSVLGFQGFAIAVAALAAPLCFGYSPSAGKRMPRMPLWGAVLSGVSFLVVVDADYSLMADVVERALGLTLSPSPSTGLMALYLCIFLAWVWTLLSCLSSEHVERVDLGVGLSLILCGGFAYTWSFQGMCLLAGFVILARRGRFGTWSENLAGDMKVPQ